MTDLVSPSTPLGITGGLHVQLGLLRRSVPIVVPLLVPNGTRWIAFSFLLTDCRNGRKSMTDLSQLARRLGMASAYHNQLGRWWQSALLLFLSFVPDGIRWTCSFVSLLMFISFQYGQHSLKTAGKLSIQEADFNTQPVAVPELCTTALNLIAGSHDNSTSGG